MALARRFLEARIKGDLDAIYEMMTPDFVSHTKLLPGQQPTREGHIRATDQFDAALSNRSIHFEEQIAQGDKVVTRFTVHATHDRGGIMGLAPPGRERFFIPFDNHRKEGGRMAEKGAAARASPTC